MKIIAKASLVAVVLSLACGTAQASDWKSTGTNAKEDFETFVDVSSIRVTGDIRLAWIKFVYEPTTVRGAGIHSQKWLDRELVRYAFNCAEELARVEAQSTYFEDGTLVSPSADLFPAPWAPVVPDTMIESWMQVVCAWPEGTP